MISFTPPCSTHYITHVFFPHYFCDGPDLLRLTHPFDRHWPLSLFFFPFFACWPPLKAKRGWFFLRSCHLYHYRDSLSLPPDTFYFISTRVRTAHVLRVKTSSTIPSIHPFRVQTWTSSIPRHRPGLDPPHFSPQDSFHVFSLTFFGPCNIPISSPVGFSTTLVSPSAPLQFSVVR